MAQPLRIVYGLHEDFVLFPYERGGRKIRLVLRRRALANLLAHGQLGGLPTPIVAPLVVGEVLDFPAVEFTKFVPEVLDGHALNAVKKKRMRWTLRHYRAVRYGENMLRFEAGSAPIYEAHTAIYSYELLLKLVKEAPHEANPSAGVQ